MRNVLESMRVWSLLVVIAGCGGDAAKPASDGDDDDQKPAPMSSCGDGEKCVTVPERDAATTPRVDAGTTNPNANDAGATSDASTSDASTPDASLAICPLEDNEDVCSTCLKFSCCEEIIECDEACQQVVQCANKCPSTSATDACAQRCFEQYPQGMAAFTAFAGCVGVQCEEACSSGG
ncbi:MAG: hypothetical protein ABW252_06845 [Polyangiales bacterium]